MKLLLSSLAELTGIVATFRVLLLPLSRSMQILSLHDITRSGIRPHCRLQINVLINFILKFLSQICLFIFFLKNLLSFIVPDSSS